MATVTIRPIESGDNIILAKIIRDALIEFKADKPGTVFYDPTTDQLFELFRAERSTYFIAMIDGEIVGGSGIFPTKGLDNDTCELVKIYLAASARGLGIGKQLMDTCLAAAKALGYKKVYLETMPELVSAVPMYEKYGFDYLNNSLGNSCHNACKLWMIKTLD